LLASKEYNVIFDPKECIGLVKDPNTIEALDKRWFGRKEDDKLILSIEELSYLLLKGAIKVLDDGEISDLETLMSKHYECFKTMFWPKLVVYNDLRSRGRRVKILSDRVFIVKHKDGSLKMVVVLEEKRLVKAEDIYKYVKQARSNGLGLVLALVSLQGDLTYYEVIDIELAR